MTKIPLNIKVQKQIFAHFNLWTY